MRTRLALALLAGLVVTSGCDPAARSAAGPTKELPVYDPCRVTDRIYIVLKTFARASYGNLMMVGDTGTAIANRAGCGVLTDAAFTSSDEAVVRVEGHALRALALGRAVITARWQNHVDAAAVEVVAAFADRIRVYFGSPSWDATDAQSDSLGGLVRVALPVHGSMIPLYELFLHGELIGVDSVTMSSSDPGVAVATARCRPREVDPSCSVPSSGWWVTGTGAGETAISVGVRQVRAAFRVRVF